MREPSRSSLNHHSVLLALVAAGREDVHAYLAPSSRSPKRIPDGRGLLRGGFGERPGLILLCLQARLEVHRFGITGYGKGKERVLERERAVMLGAQVSGCSASRGKGRWEMGAEYKVMV